VKAFSQIAVFVMVAAFGASCSRSPALVMIEEPCSTFGSEFAPYRTPLFEKASDGRFTLTISFTPAKDREADRIITAVKRGPTRLKIAQTGREIEALALRDSRLLLGVASKQEAEAVLKDLCFTKDSSPVLER
jgi:hypothetical protein